MRPTRVEIDLGALRHNLGVARAAAPGARTMAAVKADGYGHGLVRVARALEGSTDALAVACIEEALTLREAGIDSTIVLLEGFFRPEELPLLQAHRIESVVHHQGQLDLLANSVLNGAVRVWLKVDSGMHRLGFAPEAVPHAWERLQQCGAAVPVGFMTHLACADDRGDGTTVKQLALFRNATEGLGGMHSIANSAGLLGWPASHAHWSRPGVMLYGVSPFLGGRGPEEGLRPAMTFRSELIAINHLREGDAVGYGGTWVCPEPMPVGVIAAGYGDGYPRHAPSGTPVLVNGQRVPLVGRVSMDMLTVDLRTLPDASVGDPVTLWGQELPVEEVAEAAGTIGYELLCGITPRVRRIELESE